VIQAEHHLEADLDRTPDKFRLGANSIVAVSMAVARAKADSAGPQLFRHLGDPNAHVLAPRC
jgi:enolase